MNIPESDLSVEAEEKEGWKYISKRAIEGSPQTFLNLEASNRIKDQSSPSQHWMTSQQKNCPKDDDSSLMRILDLGYSSLDHSKEDSECYEGDNLSVTPSLPSHWHKLKASLKAVINIGV